MKTCHMNFKKMYLNYQKFDFLTILGECVCVWPHPLAVTEYIHNGELFITNFWEKGICMESWEQSCYIHTSLCADTHTLCANLHGSWQLIPSEDICTLPHSFFTKPTKLLWWLIYIDSFINISNTTHNKNACMHKAMGVVLILSLSNLITSLWQMF